MNAVVQNLPSAVNIGSLHGASDSALSVEFQAISRNLASSTNLTSSHIPYRQLRHHIQQALMSASITSDTILDASSLFIQLVRYIPIAYDEPTLATCFHQVVHILKTSQSPCSDGCDPNTFLCGPRGHTPLNKFEEFWSELTALLSCATFDIQKPTVLSTIINALGDLIRYSSGSRHQTLISDTFAAIFQRSPIQAHATIYKMAFPLLRLNLPAKNRESLLSILQTTATREVSNFQRSDVRLSDASALSVDHSASEQECDVFEPKNSGSESPILRLPILRLLELCCLHVLDRADQRLWLCNAVIQILRYLDAGHVQSFRSFVLKLSRHPKGRVRLFIAELTPKLVFVALPGKDVEAVDPLPWIDMLATRSNDRIPSVRVKAISALIDALKHIGSPNFSDAMTDRLVSVTFAIRSRLQDPKARVRKSAVDYIGLVAQMLLAKIQNPLSHALNDINYRATIAALDDRIWQLASILKERGNDAVSSVRIATMNQVTTILLRISNNTPEKLLHDLIGLWCETTLPRINDSDTRCKEACLKSVKAVLTPLHENVTIGESNESLQVCCSAGRLLDSILLTIGDGNQAAADLFKNALSTLCKDGPFGASNVRCLCDKIGLDQADTAHSLAVKCGAWILVAELATCGKGDVVESYLGLDIIMAEAIRRNNGNACRIAKSLVPTMKKKTRETWSAALKSEVFSDKKTQARRWIPAAISLLASLKVEDGDSLLEHCRRQILTSADSMDSETIENILIITGEVCLSFPLRSPPAESILTYVRALTSNTSKHPKLRALALTTLGKICLCQGTKQISGQVQAGETNMTTKVTNVNVFGEVLARRNMSIFVHELDNATSSATLNNAVLALCDLCRIYTATVEPYLPRLSGLLSNPSEFVRMQVLSSLIGLFQEDYIKVRGGAILYQIADCLLDSCESVRSMAEYCLLHVVTPKNPSILATSFIELIFVLNSCTNGQIYNHNQVSPRKRRFQSVDTGDFHQRLKIYSVFLSGMTLEQRIRLPGRFRTDVLEFIVDGKLDLSKLSVQAVLRDTLLLFCNDKLRCTSDFRTADNDASNSLHNDDASQQEESGAENLHLTKKLSLLNKVHMVELRETTIPVLLEIRDRLEALRSPLLKVLMQSFCKLLQPHRKELESIVRDPVLRSEVMHEMSSCGRRKWAKSEKTRKGLEVSDPKDDDFKRERLESPMDVRSMSVPRTRKGLKARSISFADVNSDDDDIVRMGNRVREEPLLERIAASPKLAAIAGQSRSELALAMDMDNQPSDFARTLARIENAAGSDVIPR